MQISEFYRDKAVLLTGCTGFVGKVLLEKLIRTTPHIRRYYILVRPRSGVPPMERIQKEIFQSPCFDRVKKELPDFQRFV